MKSILNKNSKKQLEPTRNSNSISNDIIVYPNITKKDKSYYNPKFSDC